MKKTGSKGRKLIPSKRFRQAMKSISTAYVAWRKSIPWNKFLGSLNVYKFGLCCMSVPDSIPRYYPEQKIYPAQEDKTEKELQEK